MRLTGSQISQLYSLVKSPNFDHRYLPPERLADVIERSKKLGLYCPIGKSQSGQEIGRVNLGHGPFKILAWSQMHGDESTTTRALIDVFEFLTQRQHHPEFIKWFLTHFTLTLIFQLNPDGAKSYTRENAAGQDLNRDARSCTEPESQALQALIRLLKPDLCLNCHDQRSLYSLDRSINPPSISFLAPSIDASSGVNDARLRAMNWINGAVEKLKDAAIEGVGRYDDAFCPDCFGDHLQSMEIPTILIESGHIIDDSDRESSRKVAFIAIISLLASIQTHSLGVPTDVNAYWAIPQNINCLRDIVLKDVAYQGGLVDIGIQNVLRLRNGALHSSHVVHDVQPAGTLLGYQTHDAGEQAVLINSHEIDFVNKEIASILLKKSNLLIKI